MSRLSRGGDQGSLTVFVAVIVSGLLIAFGLVVDGGQQLAAAERADSIAQQAARVGAQALNAEALRGAGVARLDPATAVAAADAYLKAAGVEGDAHADISTVTVDVTIRRGTDVLSVVGIRTLTARGHARARLAPGVTTDEAHP